MPDPPCLICAGQRGEGPAVAPVVWCDDLVWVKHVVDRPAPLTLGHLVVETSRHAPYVDSLTDQEAAALGLARRRAAAALRAELEIEAVHAFVSNRTLEHFHEHVLVRHPGTPADVPWHQVAGAPYAGRGGLDDVQKLCRRLALHFPAADASPA